MHEHQPESLKDITDEITGILSQGLEDDELFNRLDMLETKRDKKVENIGYVLLKHDERIEDIEREQARLEVLKQSIIKDRDRLMNYCVMQMLRMGIDKVIGKFIELTIPKPRIITKVALDPKGKPDYSRIDPRFVEEITDTSLKVNKDDANATGNRPVKSLKASRLRKTIS